MSQAIRFSPGRDLQAEIRRIAGKRMRSATDTLRDLSKDPDEAVHDARKDLKKLRALLRLVRDGLGEVRYRKENRALRNAGRALADFRDAAVRVELVEKL